MHRRGEVRRDRDEPGRLQRPVRGESSAKILPFHKEIIAYGIEDLVRTRQDAGERTLSGPEA
jgi:hypothetical protein